MVIPTIGIFFVLLMKCCQVAVKITKVFNVKSEDIKSKDQKPDELQ